MTFEETYRIIIRIVELARRNSTGSPEELAKKLDVPRSTLYRIIEKAKSIGFRLKYSKDINSYVLLE